MAGLCNEGTVIRNSYAFNPYIAGAENGESKTDDFGRIAGSYAKGAEMLNNFARRDMVFYPDYREGEVPEKKILFANVEEGSAGKNGESMQEKEAGERKTELKAKIVNKFVGTH